MVSFASVLRAARLAAGLTQAELGERAGMARPNVTAYESGRREPLFESALVLLAAADASVSIEAPPAWRWTGGRRPYAVPSRLWRLQPADALGVFEPAVHVWWSGPPRAFDLSVRSERLRAYEIVLREGGPSDIEAVIDGVLLCEAWPDLVLPEELRSAWADLISRDDTVTSRVEQARVVS